MSKIVLYYHAGAANHGCEAIVRATKKILNEDMVLYSVCPEEDMCYGLDKLMTVCKDYNKKLKKPGFYYLWASIAHHLRHDDFRYVCLSHKDFFDDIKKGDVCFINSGCVHKESFEEDDTFVIRLEVSDEIINAVISNAMADKQAVDYIKELVKVLKNSGYIHFGYKDDYDNELKDMLTAMISECGVADMASAYICQGLMLRILWRLGTVYEYAQSRYIRKKINWLLHQEITDFIEDNMKDVTIDMLVERFGYQEDYFNRFLKAQTGMTFTEYLQDCRLNKSAILLKEDSMDVDEIIKEVGYRNKGYFYRIFTEKYNMTPAKFRKYIKEKEFTI